MNFNVYKSSAGSGKTFRLVKEYLKIALGSNDKTAYRNILAITFTNKAANEMKSRILEALNEISNGVELNSKSYYLLEALKLPVTEGGIGLDENTLKNRSNAVFKDILHNYSYFSILTIDKFTYRIVRAFAFDLDLSIDFNVEMDADTLINRCIDQLVERIGVDDNITQLINDFAKHQSDQDKSYKIKDSIKNVSSTILQEQSVDKLALLEEFDINDFYGFINYYKNYCDNFINELQKIGTEAIELIKDNHIEFSSFASGENGISKYFSYLQDRRTDKFIPTKTVKSNIENDKWHSTKCSSDQKTAIDAIKDKLITYFQNSQQLIQNHYSNFLLYNNIIQNIYPIALINEIQKEFQWYKKEENIVHISDFNKKIAQIIDEQPAPYIYERLGERYKHFLIDEFQDTSVLQWKNLLPLVHNSLSENNYNLIVGDAKQSIYRWRGGEVDQFIKLPELYPAPSTTIEKERENALKQNFLVDDKKQNNYRSKAEIVQFNNQFFKEASEAFLQGDYQSVYADLEQDFNVENKGGGVKIKCFEADKKENDFIKEIQLDEIYNQIKQLLEEGYQLSDIAILIRKNEFGELIANYLIEREINVISSESILLGNAEKVKLLVNTLKWIHQPNQLNAILNLLNSLKLLNFSFDYNQVAHQLKSEENPSNIIINLFKNLSIDYTDKHNAFSLYELCEYLIRMYDLKQNDPFVLFFLENVFDFASKNSNYIADFIEWWDEKGKQKSIVTPEGIDAVQILTIHKSKGLEFPVVFFPFAYELKQKTNSDWYHLNNEMLPAAYLKTKKDLTQTILANEYNNEVQKQNMDIMNVLYVAFTRPIDRLYVYTKTPSDNPLKYDVYFTQDIICHTINKIKPFENNEVSFGTFEPKKLANKESNPYYFTNDFISNEWKNKISISYKIDEFEEELTLSPRVYGKLIHKLLSEIEKPEDLTSLLDKYELKGYINQSDKALIEKTINELFQLPKIKEVLTKKGTVKKEAGILLPDGNVFRPDKIVITDNETLVIDYKTGEKESKHHKQLKNYMQLLIDMGYQNLKGYLVYIKLKELVEV